jgi:hypothetical protein
MHLEGSEMPEEPEGRPVTTPNDPTLSHDSLDAVIAGYMLAVEGGEVPNRQELLDRHPEHADALRAFFADLDRMDRVASPLRLAGGLEPTGAADANGQTPPPTIRYFGDYELLEQVARGGMGIVYKARQVSLNRLVALKMILAGSFASVRDIQRFRAEAEAAANLDHPHIVPIHEVGEHEGQQYYSMKFVEGTSLAGHPRSELRTEVAGLIDVARAVHHAHQRGVLHRDLKPSNVLVDSRGTRLVTDFGLAKRLAGAERSLTESGQILGTPKYMAPEQAAGRKDLTVAADVYSLGVILYERLTGRPPFLGDNMLEVLRQVRETDPPRPSSILPGLGRDLETICLKCLQKDPARRYASAEALSEDLDHWLRGKPIAARPVGRLEKAWLWARRNPALATAGGLAVAGLVAIAVLASLAAVQAQARAKAERERRELADRATTDAELARDKLERSFARSLVSPLNLELTGHAEMSAAGGSFNLVRLNERESVALWELAESQDERLRMRFLEEGIRDPISARQLLARPEPPLIAAVGLDPARRDRAVDLLVGHVLNAKLGAHAYQAAVALIALELKDQHDSAAEHCAEIAAEAIAADLSESEQSGLSDYLRDAINRLEPDSLARVLTGCLMRLPADGAVERRAHSLIWSWRYWIAERVEPTQGAKVLLGYLERVSDAYSCADLARVLTSVTQRMEPAEAARVCGRAAEVLVDALERGKYDDGHKLLACGLATIVTERMKPNEAVRLLVLALERVKDYDEINAWISMAYGESESRGLAFQVERLTTVEAANVCAQAARSLTAVLEKETDAAARWSLALGLTTVASRMDQAECRQICGQAARSLVAALENETDAAARCSLSLGLTTVARRMDPADAAHVCGHAARLLSVAFEKEKDGTDRGLLAFGLASLIVRLNQDEAVQVVRLIATEMHDSWAYRPFQGGNPSQHHSFHKLLTKTMDSADAHRVAQILVAAIGKETDASARWWLAAGLALVAPRMEPKQASQTCGPVLQELVGALVRKRHNPFINGNYNAHLADGIIASLASLDGIRASQAAHVIFDALHHETEDDIRAALATALASVVKQMPRGEADKPFLEAVQRDLLRALEREDDDNVRLTLVQCLSSVAGRTAPAEASKVLEQAAQAAIDSFRGDPEPPALWRLTETLDSLAEWMKVEDSAKICARAARVISDAHKRHPNGLPNETMENGGTWSVPLDRLDGLVSLSGRMTADEASRQCRQAVRMLLNASQPTNETIINALPQLDTGVAKDLAREVALLLCARSTIDASRLDLVLTDFNRSRPIPRNQGLMSDREHLQKPYPCRLGTQDLVQLLKMPTCFGPVRRVVLDHLGNIHGRRFVNHWAFVRFARGQKLGLDFTTPPKRPDPKESIKRMLEILDEPAATH